MIERFIPQAPLLAHCRWVPTVLERGRVSGAALALAPDALSGDAVTAAVRRLIAEPAFTAAAQGVHTEIATRCPSLRTLSPACSPPGRADTGQGGRSQVPGLGARERGMPTMSAKPE